MKLETRIMQEIKGKKIKMRPEWWFGAIKKIKISSVVILIIVGAILLTAMEYFIEILNPRELITLGEVGKEVIWENLPYRLMVAGIVVVLVGGVVYGKVGNNYKKTNRWLIIRVTLALILMIIFLILARIGFESL